MLNKQVTHPLFAFLLLCSIISSAWSQEDTIIEQRKYTVIERYPSNQAKLIGQFSTTCSDSVLKKHGYFIGFDPNGIELSRDLYFFDSKRNRKVLGLKFGWWGWYGRTEKFFFGIRTKGPFFVDPCF